jgi:hypothetical protein
MTSRGMERSGQAGTGKELEIVDRVLATVPLRVLVRFGIAELGRARIGLDRQC